MVRIPALPLFPLNTVLFPGQLLPLHVFEPRYREMISECIVSEAPFGVVLIREGGEVGAPATPFDIGTTARVVQVERVDDGRMNILCVGEARFRLRTLNRARPFLTGSADVYPWPPLPAKDAEPRTSQVKRLIPRYMRLLARATGNAIDLEEMPTETERVASLAAIVLQVSNTEKQALLSCATVSDLLDGCIHLLRRETRALTIAASVPVELADGGIPFSTN